MAENLGWIEISADKVQKFKRAVLELDEQAIKECVPGMRNLGDGFWPVVHAVRANYRLSGASPEQVQESLEWLKSHEQNAILDGLWRDEIDYRIRESEACNDEP